jgi:tRNA(Ile)-lysidine synthase
MARAATTVIPALTSALSRGQSVVLAVSGGADSMALLHGAVALRVKLKLSLVVGHIDHGLRQESGNDAIFVAEQSKQLGVMCEVLKLGAAPRTNLEAWARNERYRALEGLRQKHSCDAILTAHTANDVAETLLMKLLSNKEPSSILERDLRRHLIRPFLRVTRERVERFLLSHRAAWRDDPSNQSMRFLRNRVRLRLLPAIREEFGDSTVESLALAGLRLHQDLELLRALSGEHSNRISHLEFGGKEWLRALKALLAEIPRAMQVRLIEQLFTPHLSFLPGRAQSERILEFILEARQALELPKGGRLVRASGGLRVVSGKL